MNQQATTTDELVFTRPRGEQEQQILTAEAVEFLTELVTRFTPKRNKLLAARIQQQQDIDDGKLPDFISETASIREGGWKIRGIPDDLLDRRVEITGPVERKMVINALNANVKVFMADFEDSLAPEWSKVIDGQINLRDAVNGTISYTNEAGKIYQLKPNPALLVCRVRGLHLPEKHVTWRGESIPGSLFDFALYFFHNYKTLLAKGSGPYFYLPKTQVWQEAAWWSEVFSYAEDRFNLPRGTIMAVFNDVLGENKNQLFVTREEDAPITAEQLLAPCEGERTEEGMRANIRVAVQYIEAWISGNGCVPIYGLMEDAATAEISRTSIWQWIHHEKTLSNGKPVTKPLFRQMLAEEMLVIQDELGEHRYSSGRFDDAARLMEQITTSDELIDFLTLPGYRLLA